MLSEVEALGVRGWVGDGTFWLDVTVGFGEDPAARERLEVGVDRVVI
jgi:hypothetical protein